VTCSGEGHFIESIATPLHGALLEYRERMKSVSMLVYDGQPFYPELTDADIYALIRNSVDSLLLRPPKAATSLWVGDKTPAYARHLGGINLLYPQARLFHIIRDPRDTVTSTLNYAARIDAVSGRAKDSRTRADVIVGAIGLWRSTMTEVEAHRQNLQGRLLELRYEDLQFNFANTFNKLANHLELETHPALIQKIERITSFQAASGGRRPGDKAPGEFHYSGAVGQFVSDLSPSEIELIEGQLGMMMSDYGYEASSEFEDAASNQAPQYAVSHGR
jgi:hypothetical protein